MEAGDRMTRVFGPRSSKTVLRDVCCSWGYGLLFTDWYPRGLHISGEALLCRYESSHEPGDEHSTSSLGWQQWGRLFYHTTILERGETRSMQ